MCTISMSSSSSMSDGIEVRELRELVSPLAAGASLASAEGLDTGGPEERWRFDRSCDSGQSTRASSTVEPFRARLDLGPRDREACTGPS